jgi:ATP synthase subunit 6
MNLMPAIALDPIHQFQVTKWLDLKLGNIDISFTNASGFMLLGVVLVITFFGMASRKGELVPSRLQSVAEMGYGFIADMVRSAAGEEGLKFFPFVFTLFFFIFFANMIGMVPYAFTTTSHIIVTGALALTVILMVIVVGLMKNGLGFFKLFAPSGAPSWWPSSVPARSMSRLLPWHSAWALPSTRWSSWSQAFRPMSLPFSPACISTMHFTRTTTRGPAGVRHDTPHQTA